jgi:Ca2+-binding RTX toxin-like protein
MLASLSILFFGISAVDASLSDLDNIKPTDPIEPETESPTEEKEQSDRQGTNTNDFVKPETKPPTQDEAESGLGNTRTYPTEEEYCRVNLLDGDSTREGYILKFGTNNDDELYGTPNRDLIFGLDGNDKIYGREGGDIICGGKGNDVIEGDPLGYNSDEVFQSKNGDNGDLPKSVSADLIFGQEGEDSILGGEGNDLIQGGTGDDSIYGHYGVWTGGEIHNDGNDLIDGGPGDDNCYDHEWKTFLNCEYTDDAVVK